MQRIGIKLGFVIKMAVALAIALIVLAVLAIILVLAEDPKAEVAAVQKCFNELPNAKITYISDLTKQASQVITAYVDVKRKGQMGFTGLKPKVFRKSSHIMLQSIGPYEFRTRELRGGEEYYGYAIDIGIASPIIGARNLGVTNVQSAVAHYDDLLALVAHWPVTTNEWPTSDQEIHFPDLPRGDYYFCLKRLDADSESSGTGQTPPGYNYSKH